MVELADVELFAGLPEKELSAIRKEFREVTQPAGKEVVTEGTHGAAFLVILDGEAEVTMHSGRRRTLGPGDYYGEMALIDEHDRSAAVTAKTDLRLLGMARWEFKSFVEEHPEVAWRMLRTLSLRLREVETELARHG